MKYITSNQKVNTWFILVCLLWLCAYVVLTLSPSSYGLALESFGLTPHHFFGHDRPIRTDEWTVWTPYTQMAVNNEFHRFYDSGVYQIDLRNFNQLPLLDWALPFKPLTWGYFLFPPAVGFSLFYGLSTVLFIIGWKQLIEKLIAHKDKSLLAIGFSLLLYFTTYVQYWWTTTGPILALTPWLILSLLSQKPWRYPAAFYISTCWLLSHTYPPVIVTMAFIGAGFIFALTPRWDKATLLDFFLKGLCVGVALGLALYYYWDAISVMANTVYPGKRLETGGDLSRTLWLSTIFPFIAQDGNSDLLRLNICEVGTGASFLPLLTACFISFDTDKLKDRKFVVFAVLFAIFSAWCLFSFPQWLAKITLLFEVPSNRMLFPLGLLINILSLIILIKGKIQLTPTRGIIFSVLLMSIYFLPTLIGRIGWFDKSAWELLLIPLVITLVLSKTLNRITLLGCALLINLVYTFGFNPISSSKPIFSIINSATTAKFNKTGLPNSGWVIQDGFQGAILMGIGVHSFATVLMQPQLDFFRKMYPDMDEETFNMVFNRYAHIAVADVFEPVSPYPDQIKIPKLNITSPTLQFAPSFSRPKGIPIRDIMSSGHIDKITIEKQQMVIEGWALSAEHLFHIIGLPDTSLIDVASIDRPDVANAMQDKNLLHSGFRMTFHYKKNKFRNKANKPICIISYSSGYGHHKLIAPETDETIYHCP